MAKRTTSALIVLLGWTIQSALAGLGSGGTEHWAFKPLTRPDVPAVRNVSWPKNAIDRFILSRLEQEGIAPSPAADRRTLVRRLYFDLIGAPPSSAEAATFTALGAFDDLVMRLLNLPQHGEHWARHWLDVVHY